MISILGASILAASILAGGFLPGAVGFVLDVSAKAAGLLLAATIATFVARRSSAAVRHRMWCLTFASLVLLPVCCVTLPRWNVAVLSAPESRPAALENANGTANPRTSNSSAQTALTEATAVVATRAAAEPQTLDAPSPQTGTVVWTALLSIWIAGAILVLARQGIEIAAVRRLVRSCRPIAGDGWSELLAESQAKLRLRRSVSLLQSETAIIPITCGVWRPVVLLPAFSVDWSPERRRCVLLHELAHVKRLDVLYQMVARVACGFYWLNPLVWYAAGRLRIERELACDDCVVAAGERASDYAEQLVEIARSCRTLRLAAGVAMARSSKLEGRVVALLDRARSHRRDYSTSLARSGACRGPALDRGRRAATRRPRCRRRGIGGATGKRDCRNVDASRVEAGKWTPEKCPGRCETKRYRRVPAALEERQRFKPAQTNSRGGGTDPGRDGRKARLSTRADTIDPSRPSPV